MVHQNNLLKKLRNNMMMNNDLACCNSGEKTAKVDPYQTDNEAPALGVSEYKSFDLSSEENKAQAMKYLDEEGYVIISGVCSPEDIVKGKKLFWDFMESFPDSEVSRNDPSTWVPMKFWLPSLKNGLLNGTGFGQSAFLWHSRLLPKVKQAFETVWNTSDLLVSFDGGNAFRPWKYDPCYRTEGGWWHCDQNGFYPENQGRRCVQGLLSYYDADATTGGLCIVPKSHKFHNDICAASDIACKLSKDNEFVPVTFKELNIMTKNNTPVESYIVSCRAGDLILWDSRLVHCNSPAIVDMSEIDKTQRELIRLVAYICMTPRSLTSKEVIQQRIEAYIHNESTSHWPTKFISAGGRASAYWLPQNRIDNISDEQRLMIGLGKQTWSEKVVNSIIAPFRCIKHAY